MMLVLFSWTASYAQVWIDPNTGDTLTCYDTETLRKIATKVTYANECDTLLKLSDQEIAHLDSTIVLQTIMLTNKNEIIANKDIMIVKRDEHIVNLNLEITKVNRKLKWTKFAWGATTVTLSAGIVLLLLK